MKFVIIKTLISIFILILAMLGGIGYFGYTKFQTPSLNAASKIITISKGAGSLVISEQLKAEGVVSDSYVFMAAVKFLPPMGTIKAGEYEFQPQMMMADVISKLKKGDIYKRQFTIPEGLTSFEILERLKNVSDIVIDDVPIPEEGSLLPDTYQYTKDDKLSAHISTMQSALKTFLDKEWVGRDTNLPFTTIEQALTLASIVEKETGVASERKRIAGVFINRLRIGMPLQTDPTVIYALTKGQHKNDGQGPLGRKLYSKDLSVDSPYNTYKNVGLPPTPIANAGRDAILAVLHPETNDFLFFVADGTGGHVFARTLSEHNQNVANWRKLRRSTDEGAKPESKD